MILVSNEELEEFLGEPPTRQAAIRYFSSLKRIARNPGRTDRKTACAECPVLDGMYAPIAALLCEMEPQERAHLIDRWWCHTDTRFCCNGAREYLKAEQEQNAKVGSKVGNEVLHDDQ